MIKGRKVYDTLTDTWSTGYWVADDKGNYYPIWQKNIQINRKDEKSRSKRQCVRCGAWHGIRIKKSGRVPVLR